jgi:ElaB/YqjD/DUF883 family membrane-anchored ribosome-binding protein
MANAPIKDTDRPESATSVAALSAASANTSRAAGNVSEDADTTAADLETLRADVVKLTKAVSSLVSAQAVVAKETVTDKASELYDTGVDYVRTAEGQVRGMAEDVSASVQRNPLASIGIVFGIGYIIGLLRRR